jgi:spore coat protein H
MYGWSVVTVALPVLLAVMATFQQAFAGLDKPADPKGQAATDALFTNGALHVLKINISRPGLRSLRQDPRQYVAATVREGAVAVTNVMVRLKGGAGSFRSVDDKPGLTLDFGQASASFHGLRKFHLNNSVQDGTYLSEWTCSGLFREAGVPAGRAAHAVVELNGRRLGLYVLLESINSDFLARYFKQNHGNVYSLSANADVDGGLERIGGREETNGAELRVLASAARERNRERLRMRLAQVLDLPRFLSFMAVEVMLDHWDGYTFNIKNYEVYHNPETDRIVFMPHDLDQVLRDENAPIVPSPHGVVAQAVLRDPVTRSAYQRRFQEVFQTCFVVPVLHRRINQRVTQLAAELKKYDPGLAVELIKNSEDLKERIVRRARALAQALKAAPPAVDGGPATFLRSG